MPVAGKKNNRKPASFQPLCNLPKEDSNKVPKGMQLEQTFASGAEYVLCPNCNREFVPKRKSQKFCADQCRSNFHTRILYHRNKGNPCLICGKPASKKYCSKRCNGIGSQLKPDVQGILTDRERELEQRFNRFFSYALNVCKKNNRPVNVAGILNAAVEMRGEW